MAHHTLAEQREADSAALTLYIARHLDNRLTLESLAKGCGWSLEHLRTLLGPRAGWALQRLVAQLRKQRARELIAAGDKLESAMLAVGLHNKTNLLRHLRPSKG